MSTKDSIPHEWPDPTDFGLPFVEVTPLASIKPAPKVEVLMPVEPLLKKEDAPKLPIKEAKEIKTSRPITPTASPLKEKKVGSKAWVGFVILGFLAIGSVIVWQIQTGEFSLPEVKKEVPIVAPVTLAESNTLALVDTVQMVAGADSIAKLAASTSAQTIASNSPVSLIRINSKEAKPRFFVIIGSFGSEQETLRYIENLQGKFLEYHLIAPYTGNTNFRLAIGKFASWNEASIELERIKSGYPKGLWILNY